MADILVFLDVRTIRFTLFAKKFVSGYGVSTLGNTGVYIVFFFKVLHKLVRTGGTQAVSKNERKFTFACLTRVIK